MTTQRGWIAFMMAGALSLTIPKVANATCSATFRPGSVLTFNVLSNGSSVNTGTFMVTRAEGDFLQMVQRAAGTQYQIEATFYGGIQGVNVYFANSNPTYPEFWVGTCGPNGVNGRIGGLVFQLTLLSAPPQPASPRPAGRQEPIDSMRGNGGGGSGRASE